MLAAPTSTYRFLATVVVCVLVVLATAVTYSEAEPLNVHLVCHTHDDVGWLKTVDQYYMGADNNIQHASVQFILDSVIPALQADPARKFIYVEQAFFVRWWREQDDTMKAAVRELVKNGQLEFTNGGWCMNDEAAPHYSDIVDQMTLGHLFLRSEFDVTPSIGWHIDPFGHSSTMATLLAMMGMNAFYFARIDYQDKVNRLNTTNMETVWRGSKTLGSNADMFSGVTFNHYSPPPGFCYDIKCTDPPIQTDPRIYGVNIEERAEQFVEYCKLQSEFFLTRNIMLTMGDDFEYENAHEWYKNLDKLISYVNANYGDQLNVFYSTPSQYTKALHDANATWTLKTDDFFPYADHEYAMWSGYFTSRPALKRYVRDMTNYLQTCRHFEAFSPPLAGMSSQTLWEAQSVAQHHDAVAGTEKQLVAYDYARRLSIGEHECQSLINSAVSKMTAGSAGGVEFQQCPRMNVSVCPATHTMTVGETTAIVAYNPVARSRTEYLRVPVPFSGSGSWLVHSSNGTLIPSQVVANAELLREESEPLTLVFEATLPPLGFTTYFISIDASGVSSNTQHHPTVTSSNSKEAVPMIENAAYRVVFDGSTGRIASILNKALNQEVPVDQTMQWYNASVGNLQSAQASGAYIFRPNSTTPVDIGTMNQASLNITKGSRVQEARITFADWAKVTVRLYQNAKAIEMEYEVGPIPINDNCGKEIITSLQSKLATDSLFYTDSNGRGMIVRKRNSRWSWNYQEYLPVSGNYVPVNTAIYVQDQQADLRLTVVTEQSHGGASIHDGQVEIMLHRRLLRDDGRGVGEALNETGLSGRGLVVRTKQYVTLDSILKSGDTQRELAEHATFRPVLMLSPGISSIDSWISGHTVEYTALAADLPEPLRLETVQMTSVPGFTGKTMLLRLSHKFEDGESSINSKPVTVNLQKLFRPEVFTISNVTELSLTANQPLSKMKRFSWNTQSSQHSGRYQSSMHSSGSSGSSMTVTILPMEIRTWVAQLQQ
jgi:lysosomal alpha-mannosidase